ncbi:hypothetical protein [Moorena sp. SIO3F7]|nr:hypothetical protein [Moorena sp. SIO3F7]
MISLFSALLYLLFNREQGKSREMGRWGDREMGRWGDGENAEFYC